MIRMPGSTTHVMLMVALCGFAMLVGAAPDARAENHLLNWFGFQQNGNPVACDGCAQAGCAVCAPWCPDTYRPKCAPGVCLPPTCGSCNCYDAKCPPCVCLPKYRGRCDCYTPKCWPQIKMPCWLPDFYRCPPTEPIEPPLIPDNSKCP